MTRASTSSAAGLPANPFHVSSQELEEGEFCVDLSPYGGIYPTRTNHSEENSTSESSEYSEDEDNPSEDHDKFNEVISKRHKKLQKVRSRARGPLNL